MGYTWIKKEVVRYFHTCGHCGNGLIDVVRKYEQDYKEILKKGPKKKLNYFCPGCGRKLIWGKLGREIRKRIKKSLNKEGKNEKVFCV